MSDINTLAAKYAGAKDAIKEHIIDNQRVFSDHEALVGKLIDAENDLRDAAAESGKSEIFGTIKVTVTPQTQEVWDEDRTLAGLKVSKEQAIEAGFLKINERPARIQISEVKETV